jgi:hypothetical protein
VPLSDRGLDPELPPNGIPSAPLLGRQRTDQSGRICALIMRAIRPFYGVQAERVATSGQALRWGPGPGPLSEAMSPWFMKRKHLKASGVKPELHASVP